MMWIVKEATEEQIEAVCKILEKRIKEILPELKKIVEASSV